MGCLRVFFRRLLATTGSLMVLGGCAPGVPEWPPLQTVDHVDLSRYVGTWYEIARYPHRFQKGCVASRADYALRDDGRIDVLNQCRKDGFGGPLKTVSGTARVVDAVTNAKLEVTFFWPFWGSYWIIDLDPDYRWAIVGHPSRDYLWILSRTPDLDVATYQALIARLPAKGYAPERLLRAHPPAASASTP
jgi:apolipoprotein D and lipocalin family protein